LVFGVGGVAPPPPPPHPKPPNPNPQSPTKIIYKKI